MAEKKIKLFLSEDDLKFLREVSFGFLKLDISYLAALVGVTTAIKLSHYALLNLVSQFSIAIVILIALSLLDVLINIAIFNGWIKKVENAPNKVSHSLLANLPKLQIFAHFTFITSVAIGVTGFFDGEHSAYTAIEGRVMLQDSIEGYIQGFGETPDSIEKLQKKSLMANLAINQLNQEKFNYQKIDNKHYKVVFSGRDGVLNTNDDETVTSEYRIREAFDKFKQ